MDMWDVAMERREAAREIVCRAYLGVWNEVLVTTIADLPRVIQSTKTLLLPLFIGSGMSQRPGFRDVCIGL